LTSRTDSAGLYPSCCKATVASVTASRGIGLSLKPGAVMEMPSTRSRNSTTILSAVFLPMPGTRVSAAMSPFCTSRANSSTETPERTASAVFAPMPLTFCSVRKSTRSLSRRNP
jgi:hypothetical protein